MLGIALLPLIYYIGTNLYALLSGAPRIYSWEERETLFEKADAILVLGAGVRSNGTPSNMLEDRLLCALDLYERGFAPTVIVSGDHGQVEYDEVNVMKNYLVDRGVPSDRVFMDHAGFSTYDSLYRAGAIFGAERVLIVTQRYHSYRALMIGKHLGLETFSVPAPILSTNANRYVKQEWYSFRESLARSKDFLYCITKPEPKFLGEKILLTESGDLTNDK